MTKRAVIYIRVSTEEQADGKASPQAQLDDCTAYAQGRGYTVVKVYRDTTKYRVGSRIVEPSGTRADRPGFLEMLRDADAGLFDVLLAWREDRLYRGVNKAMLEVSERVENGVMAVELAKEHYDASVAAVKAWAAGVELKARRARTAMGVKARLRTGRAWNNSTPYGYAQDDEGFLVENPVEAEWVRKLWLWFARGDKMADIRQRFVNGSAPERRPGKSPWSIPRLRKMTRYEPYITGEFTQTWDGETFIIPCPVLVEPAIAEAVAARRAKYKAYPIGHHKERVLAAGLVFCRACNWRMITYSTTNGRKPKDGSEPKTWPQYRCNGPQHRTAKPGCAGTKSATKLDALIWQRVWAALSDPEYLDAQIMARVEELRAAEEDAATAADKLEAQLDDLVMQRQRIIAWARTGRIGEDDMSMQLAPLDLQQEALKRELSERRLLTGGQADRLLELARRFREELRDGLEMAAPDAELTPDVHRVRREVVQALVRRVSAGETYDDVQITLEIPLSEELTITNTSASLQVGDSLPHIADSLLVRL